VSVCVARNGHHSAAATAFMPLNCYSLTFSFIQLRLFIQRLTEDGPLTEFFSSGMVYKIPRQNM
jgi:hypothetical protein